MSISALHNPWNSRRRRRLTEGPLWLEVPVASPQRELHALRVVVKPHDWTREAIVHRLAVDARREAEQAWRPEWAELVISRVAVAAERLGVGWSEDRVVVPSPVEGEAPGIHQRIRFGEETPPERGRAIALACSIALPETWFLLKPLALFGGRFFRRERGYRLHLRPATDIHVPREVRTALSDLLARPRKGSDKVGP